MKIKTLIIGFLALMTLGPNSFAKGALPGHTADKQVTHFCTGADGTEVIVEMEKSLSFASTVPTDVTVNHEGESLFTAYGTSEKLHTRVGGQLSFDLPIDGVSLTLYEHTKTIVSPPGCQPGHSRITCDYQFVTSYNGVVTFNGEKISVQCD